MFKDSHCFTKDSVACEDALKCPHKCLHFDITDEIAVFLKHIAVTKSIL